MQKPPATEPVASHTFPDNNPCCRCCRTRFRASWNPLAKIAFKRKRAGTPGVFRKQMKNDRFLTSRDKKKKKPKRKKYITRTTAVFGRPVRPGKSEPYLKNVVLPKRGKGNPRTYIDDRPVAVSRSFSFYCALFFSLFISPPSAPNYPVPEKTETVNTTRALLLQRRSLHFPARSPDRPFIATRRIIRPTFSKNKFSQNNSLSAFYSGNQLFLVTDVPTR